MNKKILSIILLLLLATSCTKKSQKDFTPVIPTVQFTADLQFPVNLEESGIKQLSPAENILASDSSKHLGQIISKYRWFNFVGLSKTKYEINSIQVSAEILQFASENDSYGYFSSLRSPSVQMNELGGESFTVGNSTYIYIGEYTIVLSVEDETENSFETVNPLGNAIVEKTGLNKKIPSHFLMFPYNYKIPLTTKYYPYSFMNINDFNQIFTTDYVIESDTLTLFYTIDKSGDKYINFKKYANQTGQVVSNPNGFKYENNFSFAYKDSTRGIIVAGLINGRLVGVINYRPKNMSKFVPVWVNGLK
ncbi:MAG: DUF6599 family protein [candidate division Zixibacteria bacterium]|nr:DUF6599 family protein [candidate division Zixibacteria bacterium]